MQQQLDGLRAESNKLELQGFSKLDKMEKQLLTLVHRLDQHFTPDDMAVLQSQVSELSMSQRDTAKEYAVIRSLGFDSRDARHAAIREAHRKTFDWALSEARAAESQGVCSSGGGLARWLRSGSGTFWVSGKPGSGKSTLMKRITGHPTTKQLLSVWAHPERIVLISHYFWSAGTAMQKSQHGLLQTLLYDIFRQLPDLIESVCAERLTRPLEELDRQAWTVPELWGVLQRIAEQASLRVKFCLFIDGLDEYDGDLVDFCRALRKLSTSPHFKICVSSRPWNVFEDSFGLDPACKMYVQDFTRPDIRLFVESRLKEHPRWEEVSAEVGNADSIIGEITERAAGVFLWVFLVTKQLRDGLTEYDGFSDIRRRLDSIPNDLEVFFRQMLDSVEPFYHEKMATTLQIALAAKYPAPILVYSFHDDEYEDPNYALKLPLQPLEPRAAASRREQTSRHLSGRCRGLLEVNRSTKYVEFMHRTVMDYLRTRDISDYLEAKAPSYDPDLALLKAFTAFIKSTAFPEFVDRTEFAKYTPSELMSTVQEALAHAALLESNATVFRILEELDYVIPAMHYSGQAKLNIWGDPSNPVCLFFRECAVKADLNNYFRYILPKIPDYFAPFSPDAMQRVDASVLELFHAQRPCRIEPPPRASCSHAEGDINPASQDPTKQAWVDFLQRTLPSSPDAAIASTSQLGWLLESGSIPIMLRQGADPNARLSQRQPVYGCTVAWLQFAVTSIYIHAASPNSNLFLGCLQEFIDAGADMRATVCPPSPSRAEGGTTQCLGLDVFFNEVMRRESNVGRHGMNPHLLAQVIKKLLCIGKIAGVELDRYWEAMGAALSPDTIALIKDTAIYGHLNSGDQTINIHTLGLKRHLEDTKDDSGSRKRKKSISHSGNGGFWETVLWPRNLF